jgi:DNA-binding PadR family transcriptional regulator
MKKDNNQQRSEMLPGTLEMLILKSLERNGQPMHGYGIALYLKQISQDVLKDRFIRHCSAWRSRAG